MIPLRKFDLTVNRNTSLSIVKGQHDPTNDVWDSFQIKASVQPLDGKTLATLPENQRTLETYRVYTSTELKTIREKEVPKLKADRITIFGRLFEVIRVDNWQNGLINHYKAIVSGIDAQP